MTSIFTLLLIAGSAAAAAPAPHPVSYASCAKFDEDGFADDAPSAKAKATAYLNGALDRLEENLDGHSSAASTQARDACVDLALQHGADPNNTQAYQPPLVQALESNDLVATTLLLNAHANPNLKNTLTGSGAGETLLMQACASGNDDLTVALLAHGADPNVDQPLWMCAAHAEDRAVAAFLAGGKVPVSQLTSFASQAFGDDRETGLDASESRLDALKKLQSKNASASHQDKLDGVNEFIYTYYAGQPTLDAKADPDAALSAMLARQSHISELLKAAGWVCHQKNCGISE